jgi:hypothetical protein
MLRALAPARIVWPMTPARSLISRGLRAMAQPGIIVNRLRPWRR